MPSLPSPSTVRRLTAAVVALAASGLVLSGCGTDQGHSTMPGMSGSGSMGPSRTGAAAQGDVMFAQTMIPHHQQAVEMSELALDDASGASAEVRALAGQIAAAQGPEIATMQGWLTSWNASTTMPMNHDMGGMMSEQSIKDLAAATGEDFDRLWLSMMIEHHEGAITMAQGVLDSTADAEVKQMAQAIVDGQQREIATMNDLLK